MVIGSNILAGSSGQGGGYNISRSLRFRSSASAYLSRTPATTSNRKTWTWSGWIKRGVLNSDQILFSINQAGTDAGTLGFGIDANNKIYLGFWTFIALTSTPVYRDPSAWYHVVLAFDTTQATASNRAKVYINGVEVTAWDTDARSSITLNGDYGINLNSATSIFRRQYNTDKYTDGYLTEVNFIDGQALTPSSFGETSTTTGVWIPKRYTGTYGTNGFYLPFSDNTSTTTLGADSSGNGNNWTTNNISITSGSTYDSMTDVPTLTSATASNFATLNPLNSPSGVTLSSGNLNYTSGGASNNTIAYSTISVSSGKWYAEYTHTTGTQLVGIASADASATLSYPGQDATSYGYASNNGQKYNNGATSYGATWTANDVIGIALDLDAGTLTFYKNNVSQGTAFTGISGTFKFAIGNNSGSTVTGVMNFGQRPFAYTPPTGYVALNTFNLPTPTIGATASSRANKYFDILLYTGDGNSNRSLTGLNFQPDFVWNKARSNSYGHKLYDVIRGVTKQLSSNSSDAEATTGTANLVSFDSNGITIGNDTGFNGSGVTFVDWFWKANGSGISNTAGSISSTVSANTTSGFSVITYTGNGSAGATVGHGLGVAPRMLIIKARDGAGYSWKVYHASLGSGSHLELESTGASQGGIWNSTNPSSTVFTLGTNAGINENGKSYVCFAFANVNGYSKLDNYTGNGSSDGAFVHLGFRPRFVMTKRTNAISNWSLFDSARGSYNLNTPYLAANSNYLEETASIDFLSNGFKFRDSGATYNGSGDSYIYMAFAENPFKYSLAR